MTPAVHLAVDPAMRARRTIGAMLGRQPDPYGERLPPPVRARLRVGDEFDDALIYWPTPNAAAGELLLLLPADLAAGWYELRLLSPIPNSGGPVPIARSEPIRIARTVTLNIDASTDSPKKYDARTDGMIVLRYLFGLTGTSLTSGARCHGDAHRSGGDQDVSD